MLSGVTLACRIADRVLATAQPIALETGFVALFDGTEKTFQRWKLAGPERSPCVTGCWWRSPSPIIRSSSMRQRLSRTMSCACSSGFPVPRIRSAKIADRRRRLHYPANPRRPTG